MLGIQDLQVLFECEKLREDSQKDFIEYYYNSF